MRLLVIGCNGQVGWELVRCLQPLGEVISVGRHQLDLSNLAGVSAILRNIAPDVIVNAAAYTAVDGAEGNEVEANLVNGYALEVIAAEAKALGVLLIHYSTDYVFDGSKSCAYIEDDKPNPISVYGSSKLMGEEMIKMVGGDYIILRTSWVYAARGNNFLQTILKLAQEQDELKVVSDQIGAPTWARFIAESTTHVIKQSQAERSDGSFSSDVYHLTGAGETSWYGFAQAIIEEARDMPVFSGSLSRLQSVPSRDYPTKAPRPKNSCLATEKLENHFGLHISPWRSALSLCMVECTSTCSID